MAVNLPEWKEAYLRLLTEAQSLQTRIKTHVEKYPGAHQRPAAQLSAAHKYQANRLFVGSQPCSVNKRCLEVNRTLCAKVT